MTSSVGERPIYEFGAFRLDPDERQLLRNGQPVPLTPKAFDLLLYLVEHHGKLVQKSALMAALWPDTSVEEANLSFQISALRKALGDGADGETLIQTVPTKGYRFIGAVVQTGNPPVLTHNTSQRRRDRRVAIAIGAAACAAVVAGSALWLKTRPAKAALPHQVERLSAENLTRVTFDPGLQTDVVWSPDGKSIAYASDKTGNFDIWVQNVESGATTQVTRSPANDTQPAWSPDGSTIAFRSERDGGGIYAVPATRGPEHRLAALGWLPMWSPDGSHVLLAILPVRDVAAKLFVVGLDGAPPQPILETFLNAHLNATYPWNWAADSTHISVLVDNPFGNAHPERPVTIATLTLQGDVSAVVTLPEKISCWRRFEWRGATTLLIETCDSDGPTVWRLTVDEHTLKVVAAQRVTGGYGWGPEIAISPDGRRAALHRVVFTSRLWSVPFDASAGRTQGEGEPLTAADGRPHSFALSPDGNQVVYPLFHPGTPNEELWLTDLATHTSRRLASDAQHRFSLQWSKDGRRLAYLWTHQLENGKVDEALALWNLDTGEEQRIGSGTGESQKSSLFPTDWSPDGQAILTSSSIPKPPNMSLGLWSVAAAGHAERNPTTLAWDPDFDLGEGEARFSPNGKWIVFNAVNLRVPHSITIEVIPSTGATRSHWTTVTPPNEWADKPRWSPDGKVIYFTRYRNSYWNVWGVRFDDSTGRPIGEPFQVTHFDSVRHQIDPHVEGVELGVAARRLVLNLSEETRSIWMVDTLNR